jgi:tetratricopeptide (TPR) repeat protein
MIRIGQETEGERLLLEALAIAREHFGEDDPLFADQLDNLGSFYDSIGDGHRAVPLFERAIKIRTDSLGPSHHLVAVAINNLGSALVTLGRLTEAREQFRRAIEITRQTLGSEHPDLVIWQQNLALAYIQAGEVVNGSDLLIENLRLGDRVIAGVLGRTSTRQRLSYLASVSNQLAVVLSLALCERAHMPMLVRAGLEAVLRRKCLTLEVQAIQRRSIAANEAAETYVGLGLDAARDVTVSIRRQLLDLQRFGNVASRNAAWRSCSTNSNGLSAGGEARVMRRT